ncbi:MAG TPA: glycoside hydrolase family 172 protein [Prolixibacteraceae bacterium]|jgi:hypothetical protein
MKSSVFKAALIILLVGQRLLCLAGYKDEILKLTRIDLLPQFQQEVIIRQISSYDTTGGNDDGFSGKYSFLRKEGSNSIIAELKGPGVIQRIWTPTPSNDTIQFFFDGEKTPRIELKFIDLFSGEKAPFSRPIVGNEVGGYYCYLPIPYQSSCKIVYKGKRMQFYQIHYRELKGDQTISSFPKKLSKDEDEALSSVIKVWKNSGENIKTLFPSMMDKVKTSTKNIVLKAGDSKSIFSLATGGRVVGIEITPQLLLNSELKDLIFRARWDDETVAAINSPLSDFFGYAFGKPSMQSILVGVKDGVHYCYMPMPFDQKANIELEFLKNPLNRSTEIPVTITVYYTEVKRASDEGKFYAEWRREINPEMGKPYLILNKSGRGHYVGTALQAQGLNSGMTLFFEGDDVCTVDGEMRFHGTGSEDAFNGGWYALADRWDQAFSLPVHGCLAYSIPLAHTGAYRFFLSDKISFERTINMTIEHGPEGNKIPVDYTSVAYYYCDRAPVSNNLPPVELLKKVKSPTLQEYWLALLPIKALSSGAAISNENCKDVKTGKSYEVFKLVAPEDGFAKFELEVPSNGTYQLYMSYFKGPDGCPFEITQRQVPVKRIDGYASENTFIEKEDMGLLFIKEGTNTITVTLKDKSQKSENNMFMVHRIYLEKK